MRVLGSISVKNWGPYPPITDRTKIPRSSSSACCVQTCCAASWHTEVKRRGSWRPYRSRQCWTVTSRYPPPRSNIGQWRLDQMLPSPLPDRVVRVCFVSCMHTHFTQGSSWVTDLQPISLRTSTHWGCHKLTDILQMTFSNAFSGMKMYWFRLNFQWG